MSKEIPTLHGLDLAPDESLPIKPILDRLGAQRQEAWRNTKNPPMPECVDSLGWNTRYNTLTDIESDLIQMINAQRTKQRIDRVHQALALGGIKYYDGDPASLPAAAIRYEVKETVPQGAEGTYHWTADQFAKLLPWLFAAVNFPTFIELDLTCDQARWQVKKIE